MPAIPAFKRQREEDSKFETNVDYTVIFCPAPTPHIFWAEPFPGPILELLVSASDQPHRRSRTPALGPIHTALLESSL